jgi:hypothetical protein
MQRDAYLITVTAAIVGVRRPPWFLKQTHRGQYFEVYTVYETNLNERNISPLPHASCSLINNILME